MNCLGAQVETEFGQPLPVDCVSQMQDGLPNSDAEWDQLPLPLGIKLALRQRQRQQRMPTQPLSAPDPQE